MVSNFLFSKPENVGNAKYRPTIDRVSTNYWLIHRSSIDQLSAKCRWTKSYIGRDTSGTTIDRVSTECRPTIDQLSTGCRPTIDRVSMAISTAMSTDISVDITHSKQDLGNAYHKFTRQNFRSKTVAPIQFTVYPFDFCMAWKKIGPQICLSSLSTSLATHYSMLINNQWLNSEQEAIIATA